VTWSAERLATDRRLARALRLGVVAVAVAAWCLLSDGIYPVAARVVLRRSGGVHHGAAAARLLDRVTREIGRLEFCEHACVGASGDDEAVRKFQELRRDAADPGVLETREYGARGLFAVNRFQRGPGGLVTVSREVVRRRGGGL